MGKTYSFIRDERIHALNGEFNMNSSAQFLKDQYESKTLDHDNIEANYGDRSLQLAYAAQELSQMYKEIDSNTTHIDHLINTFNNLINESKVKPDEKPLSLPQRVDLKRGYVRNRVELFENKMQVAKDLGKIENSFLVSTSKITHSELVKSRPKMMLSNKTQLLIETIKDEFKC